MQNLRHQRHCQEKFHTELESEQGRRDESFCITFHEVKRKWEQGNKLTASQFPLQFLFFGSLLHFLFSFRYSLKDSHTLFCSKESVKGTNRRSKYATGRKNRIYMFSLI